jgi:hypothetical protein
MSQDNFNIHKTTIRKWRGGGGGGKDMEEYENII